MSGPANFTQEKLRLQLIQTEWLLSCQDTVNRHGLYWLKYRRYYLLRRLLALQLKEFDNGH